MKKTIILIILAVTILGCCWYFHSQTKVKSMTNLSKTDPELAALWKNFLNEEVIPHGTLDAKTRYLAILAAHVAAQTPQEFRLVLNQALDSGVSPVEAKETLYQTIPYVGMAKAYDFILAMNDVFSERGIKLPLENQSTTTPENRLERGLQAQRTIFGAENIDTMRANAPQELQHIQNYLSANCFGDYYTRNGLDLKTRELLTFVTLVSMGGADAQAKSHAQGNLNVGNNKDILIETITQLLPYIGYPRSLNAIAAVNAATPQK